MTAVAFFFPNRFTVYYNGCTMLLGPNKAETAAHGCHYLDVRMRELMGTPRGWCKCVSTEYPTENIGDHVQFQEPITNFLNSHTKPIS